MLANTGLAFRLLWAFGLALLLNSRAAELAYKPARIDNPLKGLIARSSHIPHSLRYIDLPLALLMPKRDQFDWSTLDQSLARIAAGGRHAVIRTYLDWPGRANTIPPFLETETTLAETSWRAGERIPNYNSPLLKSALLDFVAAFGKKYDAHPDVAFIEAGLLGAWGEWLSNGRSYPAAPPEFQKQIVSAYEQAFTTTKILFRFPSDFTLQRNVGYHDDWFAHKNETTHPLFAALTNSTHWHKSPIGGRLHPEIQKCLFNRSNPCPWTNFNFASAQTRHFTYLRFDRSNSANPRGPTSEELTQLARSLGYEFHVTSAATKYEPASSSLQVQLQIRNTGAAPFYYRWPMELALAKNGGIQHQWITNWDVRTILPAEKSFPLSTTEKLPFPAANLVLLLRIRDSSLRTITFANESQDSILPGWLTLGTTQ